MHIISFHPSRNLTGGICSHFIYTEMEPWEVVQLGMVGLGILSPGLHHSGACPLQPPPPTSSSPCKHHPPA